MAAAGPPTGLGIVRDLCVMKGAAEVRSNEWPGASSEKFRICLASWQNCRKVANYVLSSEEFVFSAGTSWNREVDLDF